MEFFFRYCSSNVHLVILLVIEQSTLDLRAKIFDITEYDINKDKDIFYNLHCTIF